MFLEARLDLALLSLRSLKLYLYLDETSFPFAILNSQFLFNLKAFFSKNFFIQDCIQDLVEFLQLLWGDHLSRIFLAFDETSFRKSRNIDVLIINWSFFLYLLQLIEEFV